MYFRGSFATFDSEERRGMSKWRRVLGYAAIVCGGISVFVFASPIFPIGIEGFFVGAAFFAAGIWALAGKELSSLTRKAAGIRWRARKPAVRIDPLLPVSILRLARERGGILTVSEAAIGLNVPLDQAEAGLRACVRSGAAVEDFDIPRGYSLFSFPEFLPPDDRRKLE